MIFKKTFFVALAVFFLTIYYFYFNIYQRESIGESQVVFKVERNESINALAEKLEKEKIISDSWLFKKYLVWKKQDRNIVYGEYVVEAPITISRIAEVLNKPNFSEKKVTILPGSNIRSISEYLASNFIFSSEEITNLLGISAVDYRNNKNLVKPTDIFEYKVLQDKPWYVSYEGYLAPETINVFEDASLKEILEKFIAHRDSQFTTQMYEDIKKNGRNIHEILVMASILEKEVHGLENKKMVSDLFWRRYDSNWALQADSTVHYAVDKLGNVFTTAEDRQSDSLWNTYKYPGLPLSPICNPSLESIMAAIYPTANKYNFFLTDKNGKVYYAITNEEHNVNRFKYL